MFTLRLAGGWWGGIRTAFSLGRVPTKASMYGACSEEPEPRGWMLTQAPRKHVVHAREIYEAGGPSVGGRLLLHLLRQPGKEPHMNSDDIRF